MASIALRWHALTPVEQSTFNAEAQRAVALHREESQEEAQSLEASETPLGIGSTEFPISPEYLRRYSHRGDASVRQEAQEWVKSVEGTIKPSTMAAVEPGHKRLCATLFGPGVCGCRVGEEKKTRLNVIEKMLFSVANACAKSEHVPMIMLQPVAGSASAQAVVVMLAQLWKKDPAEISFIRCEHGGLFTGSLVTLRDPAVCSMNDVFLTARRLSLLLEETAADRKPYRVTYSIVPVPLALVVASMEEVDLSKPAKDAELGKVLGAAACSSKEVEEEKPAKKQQKKQALFEPGTSDESHHETTSSDENEVSEIEEWDDLEDGALPTRHKSTGHVVDSSGKWIGSINYVYQNESPIGSMVTLCRGCQCSRRTTMRKLPSEAGAIRWLSQCPPSKAKSDHNKTYDALVISRR